MQVLQALLEHQVLLVLLVLLVGVAAGEALLLALLLALLAEALLVVAALLLLLPALLRLAGHEARGVGVEAEARSVGVHFGECFLRLWRGKVRKWRLRNSRD